MTLRSCFNFFMFRQALRSFSFAIFLTSPFSLSSPLFSFPASSLILSWRALIWPTPDPGSLGSGTFFINPKDSKYFTSSSSSGIDMSAEDLTPQYAITSRYSSSLRGISFFAICTRAKSLCRRSLPGDFTRSVLCGGLVRLLSGGFVCFNRTHGNSLLSLTLRLNR